jgi:hypothetical protein
MATAQRVVRVFYRDYQNEVSISSTQPESLLAERLVPLADRLLCSPDNFLGVVDRRDGILQCYVSDDPGAIVLELVEPESPGCWRSILPRDLALDRLRDLPDRFDTALLPEAEHID